MSKFDEFIDSVLEGTKTLAEELFGDLWEKVTQSSGAFVEKTRDDLLRWTELLAEGRITEQDFGDLVYAKKALLEIAALTQLGISLSTLERFRARFLDLLIGKAFDVIL